MPTEAEAGPVNIPEPELTAEELDLIEALTSEGCQVRVKTGTSDSLFITATSFETVRDIFLLHGMSFSVRNSTSEHPKSRMLWTTKGVTFFGKPFYVSRTIQLECINGKRAKSVKMKISQGSCAAPIVNNPNSSGGNNISSKQPVEDEDEVAKAVETIPGKPSQVGQSSRKKRRKRLQPTKKLNCPAIMRVTEMTVYPEFAITDIGHRCLDTVKKEKMSQLREALKANGDEVATEKLYHIIVSKPTEHNHSVLTSLMTQTVDHRVKSLIKEYVEDGITDVSTVKVLVEEYVKENYNEVPTSARSFFPSKDTIRNYIAKYDRLASSSEKTRHERDRQKESMAHFIGLFKTHRCLWDEDHPSYDNPDATGHAYNSLLEFYRNHVDGHANLSKVKKKVKSLKPIWKTAEPIARFPTRGTRGSLRTHTQKQDGDSVKNYITVSNSNSVVNINCGGPNSFSDDDSSSNGDKFDATDFMSFEPEEPSPVKRRKLSTSENPPVVVEMRDRTCSEDDSKWASMGVRLKSLSPMMRAVALRLIDDTLISAESGRLDDSWYVTPPIVFNISDAVDNDECSVSSSSMTQEIFHTIHESLL